LRTVAVAIGCILLLQIFLSGLEAALAFGRAGAGELFVICHGSGGSAPVKGDEDRKLPCSLCMHGIAGALPAGPISVATERPSCNRVEACKESVAVVTPAPARDGRSRAPPHRG
jgi:hypothetical protein